MTKQQRIDELTVIRKNWTGDSGEGYYMALTLHILTTLYNQQHQEDLLNGEDVVALLGHMDDYKL